MTKGPRDSYQRGFDCGKKDLPPNPPSDKGEAWEYWNGYLDATKDRGIGEHGYIDQERASIARRSLSEQRRSRIREEDCDEEEQ